MSLLFIQIICLYLLLNIKLKIAYFLLIFLNMYLIIHTEIWFSQSSTHFMKSANVKKIRMLLNRVLLLNVRTCLLFWVWKRLYLASKRDLEENIGKYGWISCSSLVLDRKNSKARCLLKKIWPTISSSYARIKNLLRQPCGLTNTQCWTRLSKEFITRGFSMSIRE